MRSTFLIGVLIAWLILPATAAAHQMSPGCDIVGDLDTMALQFEGYYPGGDFRETANGMAGGIKGFDNAHCRRISSLIIVNAGNYNNYIEIGLHLGYSYSGSSCASGSWRSQATVFRSWRLGPQFAPSCVVHASHTVADGEWRNFEIKDADSNLVWHFWFKGIDLGTATMNFTDGFANVLGERHHWHDVSGASFRNLEWIEYTSLIPWDDARKNPEIIGNEEAWHYDFGAVRFFCVKVSDTEINVRDDRMGSECPDPPVP